MAEFAPLTKLMMDVLGDKVEKVVVSSRLADSPCVLPTSEYGWFAIHEPYQGGGTHTLLDFHRDVEALYLWGLLMSTLCSRKMAWI